MKTLIVAFDGLDYELIKYFGLENLKQSEFGKIDNSTGVSSIKTSELFASFITGEYYEEHGVKGLAHWNNPKVEKLESLLSKLPLSDKTYALRKAVYESVNRFNAKKTRYNKDDLKTDTIFEKIENSRAMFIPSYNPSIFWAIGAGNEPLNYGYSPSEITDY